MNRLISSALLIVALTGCGADVVSTAVTEAQLSAQQAKQAKQLEDQVRSQVDAAMQTEQDRMRQAEEEANR
jgi:RNA-splicing ligase RtcB